MEFSDPQSQCSKTSNYELVPNWIPLRYYESIKLLTEMEEMIIWGQLWFDLAEANFSINGWLFDQQLFPDWITSRYYESTKLLTEMEEIILWEQLWLDLTETNILINKWDIWSFRDSFSKYYL